MTAALMVQGTGSDVGKSLIVAGLCRACFRRGMAVRPFKPQNMSNNAAVTVDGGEIGRAQALQALACGVDPVCDMNPLLLKPETDRGAQVIVRGQRTATLDARSFMAERDRFFPQVLASFEALRDTADLVFVEGAGSPAEINLRDGDIANMGFAHAAGVPVLLLGDIHRGGVIASLVGTLNVIAQEDAELIRAFAVNNFRGDISLFDEGVRYLEEATARPCAGVVPHFANASKLPAEDAVALERAVPRDDGPLVIAVPRLSRIANFDDLDPLRLESGVSVRFIAPGEPLPADADLVLLPGSKSTIGDLRDMRAQGWDIDLKAHVRRGGRVLGICGGYQMLGRAIHDPQGLEGFPETVEGLALLDIETTLEPVKNLQHVSAVHAISGVAFKGYEMHLGVTHGGDCARPFADVGGRADGARSTSGLVEGTYLHGMFTADGFRRAYLASLGAATDDELGYTAAIDETLDDLARHLETHMDIALLLEIAATAGNRTMKTATREVAE